LKCNALSPFEVDMGKGKGTFETDTGPCTLAKGQLQMTGTGCPREKWFEV